MPVLLLAQEENLTLVEKIENGIGIYQEYAQLVDNPNDKLYMCLKTLEAHVNETDQFTIDEVKAAKKEALIQVGAERKFCIQLANSRLPENSVIAKTMLPDIESAINEVAF